jgi:hypothetical protein
MRKSLLALLFCSSLCSVQAQDDIEITKNFNEVKLNGLYLVLGAFDITYERTINEESAFGITLFVPFDDENINEDINFYASPYYRFYFGKKYAAGFFVEGFGLLSSYEQTTLDFTTSEGIVLTEENNLGLALGIGVGGKWITKSGFIGELSLGIGRNIINSDDFAENLIGKIGVGVGYRF